jgi:DNA polymerase III subunit delta'
MPSDAPTQKTFEDIRRAKERNRLAQAYILVGSVRGSGLALAKRILALLFCQAASGQPCGACPACRGADEGRLPDVLFLEPVKAAQLIDVEQVRVLNQFSGQTSYGGGWKAGVLLYADRMTPSAANAFLKALEEPPPQTLFLLLTDQPHGVIPTILSRCQKVVLPPDQEALQPWMAPLAELAGGRGIGGLAGLAAAAELGVLLDKKRKEIELAETDAAGDLEADEGEDRLKARITARYKEARGLALRALLLWHRDVLMAASGADPGLFAYADRAAIIREQAAGLSLSEALARVETVEDMQVQLDQNINEDLVLEAGFTRLTSLAPPSAKATAPGHR